jgi:dienelactone hydrolase
VDLLRRRGLIVLMSDLYDEDEEVERVFRRAVHAGHEVVVFHVLTRDEIDLPFDGDVELADLGRTVRSNRASSGRAYREAIAAFLDRWRTRCATYGIDYVRVLTDTPLDEALRGYLHKRAQSVVS